MHIVYGLEDPRDSSVFYVGVTCDLYRRFQQHLKCEDDNTDKNERISYILAAGYLPIMRTFERLHNKSIAYERERYWIQHYLHLKMPLTNVVGPARFHVELPVVEASTIRQLVREHILEGCSQNDIIKQVWLIPHGGRAYQKAVKELHEVLSSLMPTGELQDERIARIRQLVQERKSQNEIITEVFPGMRNTDAIAAYRLYLADLLQE